LKAMNRMDDINIDDFLAAWDTTIHGDLMVRVAMLMAGKDGWPTKNQVVSVLCDIVEPTLAYVPASEHRPTHAIKLLRRWCTGAEISPAEIKIAGDKACEASNAIYDRHMLLGEVAVAEAAKDAAVSAAKTAWAVEETDVGEASYWAQEAVNHVTVAEAMAAFASAADAGGSVFEAYDTTYMLVKNWQADLVRRDLYMGDAR